MNSRIAAGLALFLACGLALGATAATKGSTKAAHTMTLTGCLQKGPDANTFMLTNVSGKAGASQQWELIGAPADLKMSDHVGHKVTVTGTAASPGEAKKIEGEKSAREEAKEKHLKVASLKHVAPSCP
jgi:hypothetical protein